MGRGEAKVGRPDGDIFSSLDRRSCDVEHFTDASSFAYGTILGRQTDSTVASVAEESGLPRRKFLGLMVRSGIFFTGILGGALSFRPTAASAIVCTAAGPYTCPQGCTIDCIGYCTTTQSCCNSGTHDYCCKCITFCSNARIVLVCSTKDCYFCCQYC